MWPASYSASVPVYMMILYLIRPRIEYTVIDCPHPMVLGPSRFLRRVSTPWYIVLASFSVALLAGLKSGPLRSPPPRPPWHAWGPQGQGLTVIRPLLPGLSLCKCVFCQTPSLFPWPGPYLLRIVVGKARSLPPLPGPNMLRNVLAKPCSFSPCWGHIC